MKTKVITGLGALLGILLLISLYFNWSSYRTIQHSKESAQRNLLQGFYEVNLANIDLRKGEFRNASASANRAVAFLNASSADISQFGVQHVAGLSVFFAGAFADLTGDNSKADKTKKKHDHKVITVFINNFTPLAKGVEPGAISNTQLNQAINNVYQAMTADERNQYEGAGT